jgi:hypothetical protein
MSPIDIQQPNRWTRAADPIRSDATHKENLCDLANQPVWRSSESPL